MEVARTKESFRLAASRLRGSGASIGFVPTMGSLHAGHLSLVEAAQRGNDAVLVSIFVNPLQFGPAGREDARSGDLGSYPRSLSADLGTCEAANVSLAFCPSVEEMYPGGDPETVVRPGPLAERLEGAFRPGHFEGVATVVTKLFALAGRCRAYFGEKDYQQLLVVRRLVKDLDLPATIEACPTVREPDGLAVSSRNRLLDPAGREAATALYRALEAGRSAVASGERHPRAVESAMSSVLSSESRLHPSYANLADPDRLCPLDEINGPVRLLVAASVDGVRLIDNMAAEP